MRALRTTGGVKIGCDNAACYLKGTLFEQPSLTLIPAAAANALSES